MTIFMGQDDKAIEETLDFKARFDQSRLLPAIVTDGNGVVLMFAYMNEQALKLTLQTKITHFWSRSRQSLWRKGETSGNFLHVLGVALDCDQDAIWVTAKLDGEAACHTGRYSCFYRHVILDENDNISLRFVENSHANISDAKAKD